MRRRLRAALGAATLPPGSSRVQPHQGRWARPTRLTRKQHRSEWIRLVRLQHANACTEEQGLPVTAAQCRSTRQRTCPDLCLEACSLSSLALRLIDNVIEVAFYDICQHSQPRADHESLLLVVPPISNAAHQVRAAFALNDAVQDVLFAWSATMLNTASAEESTWRANGTSHSANRVLRWWTAQAQVAPGGIMHSYLTE
jgi:hypothetical protein